MRTHAISASTIFDGERLHRGAALVVEGERIAGLAPLADLPSGIDVERLPEGAWLAPGFVDLQVNGGGDVLLNDDPSPEAMARIARAHRRHGTTGLLPTLITDHPEAMREALKSLSEARVREPGVLGIHLEGPFISPRKPGVHDPARIRRMEPGDLDLIAGGASERGVTLVTLAPEEAPEGFVGALSRAGVRVWQGHSAAGYEATLKALAEGVTGFTHLFNAMPGLGSREPGPVAAALETPGVAYGLIVDGVHVHPAMLRLALRGLGNPVLVTDAMPPVGGEGQSFRLYGEEIGVRNGRCLRADGTLAGASLDMATAVRNAVAWLGVPLERALLMASTAPAEAVGLGSEVGRLRPGYRADLVALMPETVEVLGAWVAGRLG